MMTPAFGIDRITIATLALTAALPFLAVTPVKAATADCRDQFETVRIEAGTAEPKAAAKALRTARLAEKICAEGNRFEAARKFSLARQQLDTNVQFAAQR